MLFEQYINRFQHACTGITPFEINKSKAFSRIRIISTIILFGFLYSLLFHFILGSVFGFGYPYNTFLVTSDDRFMDFVNLINSAKHLNPYFEPGMVTVAFPWTYLVWFGFSFIGSGVSFLMSITVFIGSFVFFNYKCLSLVDTSKSIYQKIVRYKNLFVLSFLTYPFIFMIDRGNFLFITFPIFALFILSFMKRDYIISSVLLAVCIAFKPFFAVFLLLFLKSKCYKEIGYSLLVAVSLTGISLLSFKGGLYTNLLGLLNQMGYYQTNYAIGIWGLPYNTSLWGLFKLGCQFLNSIFIPVSILDLNFIYPILCILLMGLISVYILFYERVFWKIVALITFSYLLLPQVSADYCLLLLFVPMYLFILYSKTRNKIDFLYSIGFGLLFIPKDYLILYDTVSISVILTPLIILAFSSIIVWEGLKGKVVSLT